ncbi:MAG: TraK family protein [Burkholderiaceae bacterium]|nr:TraK family protein [Burkholderiaceae bacterium]
MPRSYTQDLAEWVTRRETSRSRQDKNIVAFLAVKPDIQAAISAGFSLMTIWTHLHEMGKIPYRYETFLKHVRRHIKAPQPGENREVDMKEANPAEPLAPSKAEPKATLHPAKPGPAAGFTFNPIPNKEELL